MEKPNYHYDEISDTLYISFRPGEKATGIELNDYILLRLNKKKRRVIGLTVFEYSVLAQKTAIGSRSFPLSGLDELSEELTELVLAILKKPPVSEILHLSLFTPSTTETIPISELIAFPIATGRAIHVI
jgi:uncharacterized protein YuzE